MQDTVRQLTAIRRIGRCLLTLQVLGRWVTVMAVVILTCGFVDFVLRLPAYLRLAAGLAIATTALISLTRHTRQAAAFRPALSTIALRAEMFWPQLSGTLASGVEFTDEQKRRRLSATSIALADVSATRAEDLITQAPLFRLVSPSRTLRIWLTTALIVAIIAIVTIAAPHAAALSAQRWLMPLGSAQWPRRTDIQSLVIAEVWPLDTPIRLTALVKRGYSPGMRAWAHYRLVDPEAPPGQWQALLMNQQQVGIAQRDQNKASTSGDSSQLSAVEVGQDKPSDQGLFERLIDLSWRPRHETSPLPSIEIFFEAGDCRTRHQTLTLVRRPAVTRTEARIEPPPYAKGVVASKIIRLDQAHPGDNPNASALIGSRVELTATFNKPIAMAASEPQKVLPGVPEDIAAEFTALTQTETSQANEARPTTSTVGVRAMFTFHQAVQTPVHLTDSYGLTNLSDRVYRIDSIIDAPPAASLTNPSTDESVLPTAMVDIRGIGQDDIAMRSLALHAAVRPVQSDSLAIDQEANGPEHRLGASLNIITGHESHLELSHRLDLAQMNLNPGDEIWLTAVARDAYELDEDRHPPAISTARRLKIIDAAALIAQTRTELAGLRQRAIKARDQQDRVIKDPVELGTARQPLLTASLSSQHTHLESIQQRVVRNRLKDDSLEHLMDRATSALLQAIAHSRSAEDLLSKLPQSKTNQSTAQNVQAQQQNVSDTLTELADLLDQGRDALAHQVQLRRLQRMQRELTDAVERMIPRTLGQPLDNLTEVDRRALERLAERQTDLATQARQLSQRMQATASALAQQGRALDDQASAQTLADAVALARQHELEQKMDDAANLAKQNNLSRSRTSQQSALDAMQQMLDALTSVDQRRHEVLRRRLMELTESVQLLIHKQQAQMDRLDKAARIDGLESDQASLRRNTLAIADQAPDDVVTSHLGEAADDQAAAVKALRHAQREPARQAEAFALADLQMAADRLDELARQTDSDQTVREMLKLREAYLQLAQQQDQIHQRTVPLAAAGGERQTRDRRAQLMILGTLEADLQAQAKELSARVGNAEIYQYLHDRIEHTATTVTERLRAADVGTGVLADQMSVALMLRQMANAMNKEPDGDPFAEQSPKSDDEGGGGAGGSAPSPVPPLAQVRLLRQLQLALHKRTRSLGDGLTRPANTPASHDEIQQVADEQEQLARLGKMLHESLMTKANKTSTRSSPEHKPAVTQ